jgi:phosphoribosylaminoimidazole-succinocarboxamide synthase
MLTDAQLQAALAQPLDGVDLSAFGEPARGKVRDMALRPGQRVIVTTDRLSAFDRVIGLIPYKGQLLNQLAAFWFDETRDILPNHVLALPDPNVTVAREAQPLPVEVVVRRHITGVTSTSLWTLYRDGVSRPYGLTLPAGLKKNERLAEPVITPTTKAEAGGHDAPLSELELVQRGLVAPALWDEARDAALRLFARGEALAARAGLVLVDTKYELGLLDGRLCVIDEIHTPDSSRYWLAEGWERAVAEGREPEGLDKEYVRRWLSSAGYAGDGPTPTLPDAVRVELSRRYLQAFEGLTGRRFEPAELPAAPRILHNLAVWSANGAP